MYAINNCLEIRKYQFLLYVCIQCITVCTVFMDGFVSVSHCDSVIHIYSSHFKQLFMQNAENSN